MYRGKHILAVVNSKVSDHGPFSFSLLATARILYLYVVPGWRSSNLWEFVRPVVRITSVIPRRSLFNSISYNLRSGLVPAFHVRRAVLAVRLTRTGSTTFLTSPFMKKKFLWIKFCDYDEVIDCVDYIHAGLWIDDGLWWIYDNYKGLIIF